MSSRRESRIDWIVIAPVLVALAVRVWLLTRLFPWSLVSVPPLDGADYLAVARRFAAGRFDVAGPLHHALGYPTALAIALMLSGHSLFGALLLQILVGSVSCGLLASLARRHSGAAGGGVAGLCLALYGPAAVLDVQVLAEPLLVCLLLAAVWCLVVPERPMPRLAGAMAAVATLVRPTAGAAALAMLFGLWWTSRHVSRRPAALFAGAWLIVLAPVLLANGWRGAWQIQAHGGMNLYIGNSPTGSGTASVRLGGPYESLYAEAAQNDAASPAAEDRYFTSKLIGEIRSDPVGWVRVMGRKLVLSVRDEEIRDTHSYAWFREVAPEVKWLLTFGVLVPFVVAGLMAGLRPWSTSTIPVIVMLTMWATVVVFVVGWRYRAPMAPFLCFLAGAGILPFARRVRCGLKNVAAISALAAIAGVVSCHGSVKGSVDTAEEWVFVGTRMVEVGDTETGRAHLERVLSVDPDNSQAWAALGSMWLRLRDDVAARTAATRALAANPQNPKAHAVLAAVAIGHGELNAALDHLAVASRLRPGEALVGIEQGVGRVIADQRDAVLFSLTRTAEAATPRDSATIGMLQRAIRRRASGGGSLR